MEPTEINGGRFYARPLHNDDRIDDTPALEICSAGGMGSYSVEELRQQWADNTAYSWAVCEQTNVDMVALAVLHIQGDKGVLDIVPVGDPNRALPNDPVLEPKTVGDAVEIRDSLVRWAKAHGIEV